MHPCAALPVLMAGSGRRLVMMPRGCFCGVVWVREATETRCKCGRGGGAAAGPLSLHPCRVPCRSDGRVRECQRRPWRRDSSVWMADQHNLTQWGGLGRRCLLAPGLARSAAAAAVALSSLSLLQLRTAILLSHSKLVSGCFCLWGRVAALGWRRSPARVRADGRY